MKKTLLSLLFAFIATSMIAQSISAFQESSPNAPNPTSVAKSAWTVQFNYPEVLIASAGSETDGNYFYITQWNSNKIWKLSLAGVLVDSFSIPGVTGLRDLAYDGTYFYGGASANTIYKMDFTNHTLVGSISSPSVTVRNICYNPTADAFWVANWATDFNLVSRTGTVLATISAATHGQTSMYGTAYDTITPGGPYIYAINANSAVNTTITQINAVTGLPTGLSHDMTTDVCPVGGIGGGLWIAPNIVTGTVTLGGVIQGINIFGYDLASISPDSFDLEVTTLNLPSMVPQGQNFNIAGVITNQGTEAITSFELNYKVDAGTVVTQSVTGVNIASFATYNFTHSTPWVPANGSHTIYVWTSNPNNHIDQSTGNDSIQMSIIAYDPSSAVQRLPLHESFTSSTCAPCVTGNANMKSIFTANPNKWVLLKYQMSWPGSGDPYYTAEGGTRRTYYNVSSVPNLKVDGGFAFDDNSSSYTTTALNAAYAVPSFVDLTADLVMLAGQDLKVDVNIDPNIDLPASVKLFVAIVEKTTFNNVGSNGEVEFDYVMKKMLPDANGKVVGPLTNGTAHAETLNYTFVGNYRCPANATSPINHSIEHSIEDFNNLIAVVWLQDVNTKAVFQAAYSSVTLGLQSAEVKAMELTVSPNPASNQLTIKFNVEKTQLIDVKVISTSGKLIYNQSASMPQGTQSLDLNIQDLAEGIYFVSVSTSNGSYTKPVVIKH
jgi:hypothetical protein